MLFSACAVIALVTRWSSWREPSLPREEGELGQGQIEDPNLYRFEDSLGTLLERNAEAGAGSEQCRWQRWTSWMSVQRRVCVCIVSLSVVFNKKVIRLLHRFYTMSWSALHKW